jgi:DNA-binding MarR family transcriptional regulator
MMNAKYVNMVDAVAPTDFLREADIRRGIELLYFGYTNMIKGPDSLLAETGFGRAHHRAMYFIARRPGLPVSDLLLLLNITKQSLSRVLSELQAKDLVAQEIGKRDRRQRLLSLTEAGARLEADLFDRMRNGVADAYRQAGPQSVSGFWAVLSGLIPAVDRPLIQELQKTLR